MLLPLQGAVLIYYINPGRRYALPWAIRILGLQPVSPNLYPSINPVSSNLYPSIKNRYLQPISVNLRTHIAHHI